MTLTDALIGALFAALGAALMALFLYSAADRECYLTHKLWYSPCKTTEVARKACTPGQLVQRQQVLIKRPGEYPALPETDELAEALACNAWGIQKKPETNVLEDHKHPEEEKP